jgi:molybdopterin-containing oxidoreductase family iron-sulfur binding subunit
VACPYGVNYFNWQKPEKAYYAETIDWTDPDIQGITGGAIPPYRNPDLDKLWGPEQRRTAGGGHAKGVMEKCTFCVHRVEQGRLPACVDTCPVTALRFGDIDDPETPISQFIRGKETWHLLGEAGTQPSVFYVGGKPPDHEYKEVEQPKATV